MRDLARLPKAHLHLHLDGAMRPATFAELAARDGVAAPMPEGYGSFADFTDTIVAAAGVLRDAADVERVVAEIAADAAADGAVWVEVSAWPGLFAGRLGSDGEAVEVLLAACRAAATATGVGVGLVLAANRDRGPAAACEVARLAAARTGDGVVGFGLDGDEAGHPPAPFADAFALARAAGLPALPHAGEHGGPDGVADALDLLGARRVMHGVRAIEDDALVARLAADGICLDVCPTSNVMLSVVPALEQHPLGALLDAGVRCTVNADDPLLFGCSLLDEYERCRAGLGFDDTRLAAIARASLACSSAPPETVRQALAGVDAWLAVESAGAEPAA